MVSIRFSFAINNFYNNFRSNSLVKAFLGCVLFIMDLLLILKITFCLLTIGLYVYWIALFCLFSIALFGAIYFVLLVLIIAFSPLFVTAIFCGMLFKMSKFVCFIMFYNEPTFIEREVF